MKTSNLFIAQQCDQAGEVIMLEECIASGQVSAAQVEAHRAAGEIRIPIRSTATISEFTIADLAIKHLGSYAEKDYDFAMAVLCAQDNRLNR